MTYVFRNNTIERFLEGDYCFSGYDDYGDIPAADAYLWWYQVPIKMNLLQAITEVESYAQRINVIARQIGRKPLTILTLTADAISRVDKSDSRLMAAIDAFNANARDLANRQPNIRVVNYADFTRRYAQSELIDWKYYMLSQMPLNPRLARDFKEWFSEQERALAYRRKKCLILDLDNTLWGGILGEDGIDGIQTDGDYPGKAYHIWQEGIKELMHEGVILAICSKNNETDVKALFAAREMPLKWDDFIAKRINWTDKASNIRSIAEELNIGLDSIVFIDDNPSEREYIRQQIPEVEVPEYPEQPYGLITLYNMLVDRYFSTYQLTDEDRKKVEQYKQNAHRARIQAQFTDMTAFLRTLDMRLKIFRMGKRNIAEYGWMVPRITQMTQKTNQFNLTTRRYDENDIRAMISSGAEVWALAVTDRFGDNGITGLMIVKPENGWTIDTMLMSCRILGKGIEEAFFRSVMTHYSGRLQAEYIPTAKNGQVADFYDRMGLKVDGMNDEGIKEYTAPIEELDTRIKEYYTIEQ